MKLFGIALAAVMAATAPSQAWSGSDSNPYLQHVTTRPVWRPPKDLGELARAVVVTKTYHTKGQKPVTVIILRCPGELIAQQLSAPGDVIRGVASGVARFASSVSDQEYEVVCRGIEGEG